MHEVDLSNYNIRTDLAIEAVVDYQDKIKQTIEEIDDIKVTKVIIENNLGSKINKKDGTYITIEFDDVTDHNNKEKVANIFAEKLKELLDLVGIGENDMGLVIGLGNDKSTPDALGPLVVSKVLVTNHLFLIDSLEEGFKRMSAFAPGVMGTTGVETSDIIIGIVKEVKPDFILVVDALASQSIERVNRTIQMTDTGIHPGSGVGNKRKEISKEVINVPVIAIGVPTVVDAVTIVSDTINYMTKHYTYSKDNFDNPIDKLVPVVKAKYTKEVKKEDKQELLGMLGNLDEYETKQLIFEVLTPLGYNLMVTPKEVDFIILKLSEVISLGINRAIHPKVD